MERRTTYMVARFFSEGEVARHLAASTPFPDPRIPPKIRLSRSRTPDPDHGSRSKASEPSEAIDQAPEIRIPPPDLAECIPLGVLVAPSGIRGVENGESDDWTPAYRFTEVVPDGHELTGILAQLDTASRLAITFKVAPHDPCQLLLRIYLKSDDYCGVTDSSRRRKRSSKLVDSKLSHSDWETLLSRLDCSTSAWQGAKEPDPVCCNAAAQLTPTESLFYFYNNHLPSPALSDSLLSHARTNDAIAAVLSTDRPLPDLLTQMYPYQRRSAALMIQREEHPEQLPNPVLEPMTAADGRTYYYNTQNRQLSFDKTDFPACRGGILAETMGLGKTLICLAVILATKYHYPEVPTESLHPTWPSTRPKVGSLVEMASAAAAKHRAPWKQHFDTLGRETGEHYTECVKEARKHPRAYIVQPPPQRNPRKAKPSSHARKIMVSTGTVIVCPPNLIQQWQTEISKHTESGSLNVLNMDIHSRHLPDAEDLLHYDIVLFSRPRFDRERLNGGPPALQRRPLAGRHVWTHPMSCPGCPLCTRHQSPMLDIHWKRLIVDEGDCMSNISSESYVLAHSLVVERRWLVTGTPTGNLVGAEVGMAAQEHDPISRSDLDETPFDTALQRRREETADQKDHKDLTKLGFIARGFLKVQPWSLSSQDPHFASWQEMLRLGNPGPLHLSGPIRRTLADLLIKHRPEDVDKDITLPPLSNRIVYLEPSYFDKLSQNLLISVLIVNAVASERTGEDYMFHPGSRKALDQLVVNLRQAGFFWSGFSASDVQSQIRNAHIYLEKSNAKCSAEDRALLLDAVRASERALASPDWQAFSSQQELGCYVEGFPDDSRALYALSESLEDPLCCTFTALSKAQSCVRSQLYAPDLTKVLRDAGQKLDRALEQTGNKHERRSGRRGARSKGSPRGERDLLTARASQGYDPMSEMLADGQILTPQHDDPSTLAKSILKKPERTACDREPPADSPLADIRIIGTASRKLSYLLDQMLRYQRDEKILCFYEGDHIAWYISQALDVCQISHLIYSNKLSAALKAAYVKTFSDTDKDRVLLIDIRHAARGLTLTSASRIYFVNPEWRPDVEAQAIKRAHRIGQLRPVFVETLVLKGTFEDRMLQRRKAMSLGEQGKAKNPLDDGEMKDIFRDVPLGRLPVVNDRGYDLGARLRRPQPVFYSTHNVENKYGEGPSNSSKRPGTAINIPPPKDYYGDSDLDDCSSPDACCLSCDQQEDVGASRMDIDSDQAVVDDGHNNSDNDSGNNNNDDDNDDDNNDNNDNNSSNDNDKMAISTADCAVVESLPASPRSRPEPRINGVNSVEDGHTTSTSVATNNNMSSSVTSTNVTSTINNMSLVPMRAPRPPPPRSSTISAKKRTLSDLDNADDDADYDADDDDTDTVASVPPRKVARMASRRPRVAFAGIDVDVDMADGDDNGHDATGRQ